MITQIPRKSSSINTEVRLRSYIQNLIIGVVLLLGVGKESFAQCPTASFQLPSNICAGQSFTLQNRSTGATTYRWDFCNEALNSEPLARDMAGVPGTGNTQGRGHFTIKSGDSLYTYLVASNNSLYRLTHGIEIKDVLGIRDLGSFGGIISNPQGLKVIQDANGWHAIVLNGGSNSRLVRIGLGQNLHITPIFTDTSTFNTAPESFNTATALEIVRDGNNYFGFVGNQTGNRISVINFGSQLRRNVNSAYSFAFPTNGGLINGLSVIKQCNVWALGYTATGNVQFSRTILGQDLNNAFPSTWATALTTAFGAPSGVTMFQEGGRTKAFIGFGGSGRLVEYSFASSITQTSGIPIKLIGFYASLMETKHFTIYRNSGAEWVIYSYNQTGSRFGRLVFEAPCTANIDTSNAFNPTLSFTRPGRYAVALRATTNGNTAQFVDSITVGPAFTPNFSTNRACGSLSVNFSESTILCSPNPITQWNWNFGDGVGSSTLATPTYNYTQPGEYSVRLRLTNALGLSEEVTKLIIVENGDLQPAFTAPASSCSFTPVFIEDRTTFSVDTIRSYLWNFGNNQTSTQKNPTAFYTQPGTYTIILRVTGKSGCERSIQRQITISPSANLSFTTQNVCLGGAINLTSSVIADPGATVTSLRWNFGDGSGTSTLPNPSYTYQRADTFIVTLTATLNNGCEVSVQRGLRVFALPTARISTSRFVFANESTQFIDSSLQNGNPIAFHRWNFGSSGSSGNISNQQNPTFNFPSPGLYTVKLFIRNTFGCEDSTIREIEVFEKCPPFTFTLQNDTVDVGQTVNSNLTANNVSQVEVDFCGGDLALTPVILSQSIISTNLTNTNRIAVVKEGNKWYGFGVNSAADGVNGTNVMHLYEFDTTLKNEPRIVPLGNYGGLLVRPTDLAVFRENGQWNVLVLNTSTTASVPAIIRLNFGASLNPLTIQSVVPLPYNGTQLRNAVKLEHVSEGDSTFLFVVLREGNTNNLAKIVYPTATPNNLNFSYFDNPPALQSSPGLRSISIIRECNQWLGFLTGPGLMFRLNFGPSLSFSPSVENITQQFTSANIPGSALTNLTDIVVKREGGKVYGFLVNTSGNLLRFGFQSTADGPLAGYQNFGNLAVLNNTNWFTIANDGTEWFGFSADNNASRIYLFQFPNICSASVPYFINNTTSNIPSPNYALGGNYNIATSITDTNGFIASIVRPLRVRVSQNSGELICNPASFNVTSPNVCRGNPISLNAVVSNSSRIRINAGANNLGKEQRFVTNTDILSLPNNRDTYQGINFISVGGQWIGFAGYSPNNGGLMRFVAEENFQAPRLEDLGNFGGAIGAPNGLKAFQFKGRYYLAGTQNNGLFILDFENGILNTPSVKLFSANGLLPFARALEVIEENGNIYVLATTDRNNNLLVYDFGSSMDNFPNITNYPVAGLGAITSISAIKECNRWYAWISDQTGSAIVSASFDNSLKAAPRYQNITSLAYRINNPSTVRLAYDYNSYYAYIHSTASGTPLLRVRLGGSIASPQLNIAENLGTFGGATVSMSLEQQENSQWAIMYISRARFQLAKFTIGEEIPVQRPVFNNINRPDLIYSSAGTYFIQMTATDTITGSVGRYSDSVVVREPAQADFTWQGALCKDNPIRFRNLTQFNTSTSATYAWNFGDTPDSNTVQSTLAEPVYSFSRPGVYRIRLRINESSGCTDQKVLSLRIVRPALPNFTVPPPACSYDSLQILDRSTGGEDTIATRTWRVFRPGGELFATSTAINPRFSFPEAGNYTVTLTLRGRSGCDTTSPPQSIFINRQGTGFAINSIAGTNCLGDSLGLQLTPNPGEPPIFSLIWDLGNGTQITGPGTLTNVKAFYPVPGNVTVRVTAVNELGCSATISRTLRINQPPQALIASSEPCRFAPTVFTTPSISGDGIIVRRIWTFGDGTADSLENTISPAKVYADTGVYQVRLRMVSSTGCVGEATTTVRVSESPRAVFDYIPSCPGEPFRFVNQSSANGIAGGVTSFAWDFGNGTGSAQENPITTYQAGGRYNVTLTVLAGNCSNTLVREIDVPFAPTVAIGLNEGCVGAPFIFIDQSNNNGTISRASQRRWQINGRTYTDSIVSYLPSEGEQLLDVSLTHTNLSGCTGFTSQTYQVFNNASANFRFLDTVFITKPYTVRFSNTSSNAERFIWHFGNGDSSTLASPVYTYENEGVYRVCLRAFRNNQCYAEFCRIINIVPNARPDVSVNEVFTSIADGILSVSARVSNKGNTELRRINFVQELENFVSNNETWSGSLMPGETTIIPLRTQTLTELSRRITQVCVSANIPNTLDVNPSDNRICKQTGGNFNVLDFFPNPPSGEFVKLRWNSGREGKLTILLIDATGREFNTLSSATIREGTGELEIPVKQLAPGFYQIRFRFEDEIVYKTLIVQ